MEIQLIGAGGLAKDILACFRNEVTFSGIWDDALVKGDYFYQVPVLGKVADIPNKYATPLIIAVGHPPTRKRLFQLLENAGADFATLVHSTVTQYDSATIQIEKACVLMPRVYLTSCIRIASNSLLHIQSALHHDVHLGSHSVLMPGSKITCAYSAPELFMLDSNQVISSLSGTNKVS